MATNLYSGVAAALSDAFTATGTTFTWRGNDYGCVLNVESALIVTSKDFFPGGNYPRPGETIRVVGKDRIVLGLANADSVLVPGGRVEATTPFVDDPTSPGISIHYGATTRG